MARMRNAASAFYKTGMGGNMKKLIFWAGMIITIGVAGNEDDSIALVATIGVVGILMMQYGETCNTDKLPQSCRDRLSA